MSDDEDLYCNPETNIFLQSKASANKPNPKPSFKAPLKAPLKAPGLPGRTPTKPPKPALFKRKAPDPVPCSEESAEDELKNLFKNGLKRPSEFRLTPVVPSNDKTEPKIVPRKPALFPPSQGKEGNSPFPKLRHVEGSVLSKTPPGNESISPSRLRHVESPFLVELRKTKPDECPSSTEVDSPASPSAPAVPRRTSRLSSYSGSVESLGFKDPTSPVPIPENLNSPTASAKSANSQASAMFEPPAYNQYGHDDPEELYTENDLPPIPQEESSPKRRALKPISAPPRIPLETFPGTYNPEEDPEEMYNDPEIELYPLNPNLPPPTPPSDEEFDELDESDGELYADADFPEPLQPPRLPPAFPSPFPTRAPPPISPMPTRAPPPMQAPPPRGPPVCPPPLAHITLEDPDELEQFDDPDEMYTENDLPCDVPAPYSPYNPDFEDDEELYADPDFADNIPHQPDPSPIPPQSEYNPDEEGDDDIYADIDEYLMNKQVQSMMNPSAPPPGTPPPPAVPEISTPDIPSSAPPPVKDKKQKKGLLSIFKKKKEEKSTECLNAPDDLSGSSHSINNSGKEAEKSLQNGSDSGTDFEDDELYADGDYPEDDYPDCDEIYELEE